MATIATSPLAARTMRPLRLAAGRTRGKLRRDAKALRAAARVIAERGDGNEAARILAVAEEHLEASRHARWF